MSDEIKYKSGLNRWSTKDNVLQSMDYIWIVLGVEKYLWIGIITLEIETSRKNNLNLKCHPNLKGNQKVTKVIKSKLLQNRINVVNNKTCTKY